MTLDQPHPMYYGAPCTCPKCHYADYLSEFEYNIKDDLDLTHL